MKRSGTLSRRTAQVRRTVRRPPRPADLTETRRHIRALDEWTQTATALLTTRNTA